MSARPDLDALDALLAQASARTWKASVDCFADDEDFCVLIDSTPPGDVYFKGDTEVPPYRGDDSRPWTAEDSALRDARWHKAKDTQPMRDAQHMCAAVNTLGDLVAYVRHLEAALKASQEVVAAWSADVRRP